MKKTIALFSLLLAGMFIQAQTPCGPRNFPGYKLSAEEADSFKRIYAGRVFELSQDYPAANKLSAGSLPFNRIDFVKDSKKYMESVIVYALEGMTEANWVAQNNKVRKWYHAPWMDAGQLGREPINGLVMQRQLIPSEIDGNLPEGLTKNYAISFYNEAGGYTIGQVWCNPESPDPSKGIFPVGTVAVQLTFTTADSSSLPKLAGGIVLDAWIDPKQGENKNKEVAKVTLMQVDIMVKTDNPAAKTGWVFASYFFDGTKNGKTLAEKFWPIGLAWGQDPGVKARDVLEGGVALKEQWINTDVFKEADRTRSSIKHLGWGNRLASPVDNMGTSCMSCHSTAGFPMKLSLIPNDTMKQDSMLKWFRNIKAPEAFMEGQVSLDYSMELAAGIRNFHDAAGKNAGEVVFRGSAKDLIELFTKLKSEGEDRVDIPPGLSTSRRTVVFFFFLSLIGVLAILLVYNLMKKD